MVKTVPADYIGRESVGYVLLALLSESTKKRIEGLLNSLTTELPDVLWPMPSGQLHITLCEIIQPKDYSQDKEALYRQHKEQYETVPAQVLSSLSKFKIMFDSIDASPQAITIRSSDATKFNTIRAQLVQKMALPTETRTPPDIVHSTIARYIKEVDLEKVQRAVQRHKIFIEEEIAEFKLLRNEIPPLQKYEVLKTYSLV